MCESCWTKWDRARKLRKEEEARKEADEAEKNKPRTLYWSIKFSDPAAVLKIFEKALGDDPATSGYEVTTEPHVTLLYLGGETEPEAQSKRAGVPIEEIENWVHAYEAFEHQEVEIRIDEVAFYNNDLMAAVCKFEGMHLPCKDESLLHCTVAIKKDSGVKPVQGLRVMEILNDSSKTDEEKVALGVAKAPTKKKMQKVFKGEFVFEIDFSMRRLSICRISACTKIVLA